MILNRKIYLAFVRAMILFIVLSCNARVLGFSVSPTSYDFGNVPFNGNQTKDFILKNDTPESITVVALTISGTNAADFTITAGGATPINIAANSTHSVTIKFEPLTLPPPGLRIASLTANHSGAGGSEVVSLQGTCVVSPDIQLSATSYDFGLHLIGSTATQNFQISNTGTGDLVISSFGFSGTNAGDFSIIAGGATPATINPAGSLTITVEFAPTFDGAESATLSISHNDTVTGSPSTITLQGRGSNAAPIIDLDRTSPWDFGIVGVALTSSQDLQISNSGNANLIVTSLSLNTGAEFSINQVLDSSSNPVSQPYTVVPSDYITVTIDFTPVAATTYTDTLVIVHNDSATGSPTNITLDGEGNSITTQTFNYTGATVNWIVPAGITSIIIEAWGAQGGINDSNQVGGFGTRMKGSFIVTPGQTVKVLVGEQGEHGSTASWSRCGGGSGGSFIWIDGASSPLIVAGGGGGKGYLNCSNSMNASITQNGVVGFHPGGTNGNGGTGGNVLRDDGAGGGGGWLTNGTGLYPGMKVYNGTGAGGISTYNDGGFGGGGGSSNTGGGGGGYSGGGGGWYGFNTNPQYNGGGGGSYNSGTNQDNAVGTRAGNGQVTITY